MGMPSGRFLGRVLAPREGEDALEPHRQRYLQATPRKLVDIDASLFCVKLRSSGGGATRSVLCRFLTERDRGLHAEGSCAGPRKGGAAMIRSAPLSVDLSQEQVEAMMERGTAFSEVEDVIDASGLSTIHKAALWLLAWSLRDV